MENLATRADLIAYGYPAEAESMLTRASARVRGYTRQQITLGSSVVTLGPPYRLPQRPVRSVHSVLTSDGRKVTHKLIQGRLVVDTCEPLTVTYAHGYVDLPPELVELVCSIANRMHASPDAIAMGVRSEGAGGEQVTWGTDAYVGSTDLTSSEKAILDRIFPSTRRLPSTAVLL